MKTPTVLILLAAFFAAACGGDGAGTTTPPETPTTAPAPAAIRLLTHDSFAISESVLAEFEAQTGSRVELVRSGDAGTMLNQAILTAGNPVADVLFGVDNTFLSRALDNEVFVPHESPGLASVPPDLHLDPQHRVTPIDFGNVCLNYDKVAFDTTPPPESLLELTGSQYRGMLVVENPAMSSPGMAFLLATIAVFGEEGDYTWRDFWADLRANDVAVAKDWESAYYGSFSGGSGAGDRPIVVSYASSPPVEVIFAETPLDEAPTGVITDGCFRQIEFAGILRGTDHEAAAGRLIDFMLGLRFQEDIPLNMFMFPANGEAALPPEFIRHTTVPHSPATLDPALIEANRERWLEEWTSTVLR
jgi:thiamine transport system substrate-binding protein